MEWYNNILRFLATSFQIHDMKFIKSILLIFFSFHFVNTSFSQKKIELPTHADGSPFICEKFEMLEKNLKNLQLTNTSITPPSIPGFNTASTRTDEEVQVGDSNTCLLYTSDAADE